MANIAGETTVFDFDIQDENDVFFDPDILEIVAVSPEVFGTDLAIANSVGLNADLTGVTTDLAHFVVGDVVRMAGFVTAFNNGRWVVAGPITAQSVSLTKDDGNAPTDETAGASVRFILETLYSFGGTEPAIIKNGVGLYTAFIPTTRIDGLWEFSVEGINNTVGPPARQISQKEIFRDFLLPDAAISQ